jgi:aldehyde dehydrogenase (NAD+)
MFGSLIQRQRDFFNSGKTLPLEFRIGQLKKLKDSIALNEKLVLEALYKDLR